MTVTPVPFSSSAQRQRERKHERLRGRVRAGHGRGRERPDGAEVHDPAPAALDHAGSRSARVSSVSATTFTCSMSTSSSGSASDERPVLGEPRVVHQRVDLHAALVKVVDKLFRRVRVREILRQHGRRAAEPSVQHLRELLHGRAAPRDEHQVEPVPREEPRELRAEPARGPGDQGGATLAHQASSWKTRSIARRASARDAQVVVDEPLSRVLLVAQTPGERRLLLRGRRHAPRRAVGDRPRARSSRPTGTRTPRPGRARRSVRPESVLGQALDRLQRAVRPKLRQPLRRNRISDTSTANCTSASDP